MNLYAKRARRLRDSVPRRHGVPSLGPLVAAIVAGLLPITASHLRADEPIATPMCALHLLVELTPDVVDPGAGDFVSSLLGNHPGFQLFVVQVVDDTHLILQLQGPGAIDQCQSVLDSMRNDGRVVSIQSS